jgi:GT2 family glycosyltransferase
MNRLAALLTVHNRREKTLAALERLFMQEKLPAGLELNVYLVDDASSDGTPQAIAKHFPQVRLIRGTGDLFWCGGMRLAFCEAMQQGFNHYLWLNDDTALFPDALSNLLDASVRLGRENIVVGSTHDPETHQLTYGGVTRLHRSRRLHFTPITPGEIPLPVETMNGNCVLIPQAVVQKVGNLDPAFTHGMGDFDYGLRARKLGIGIYIAPGYYGDCLRNPPVERNLPFVSRWRKLLSPHGLPPREWAVFARRYAGRFWFVFWMSPYLRYILGNGRG